ncbi:TRAP transporter large permease [Oceanibacterium hippocampi]|uniref:TRAP transporter large permease protein n=1 Tax=Oceanibacterium hippocampi TaxID=745714 RepID=A0A1Y5TXJ8_9PROT|nr:TRAP transporter large permease subunit [Oceanibacterium hippocampi]SLN73058.1 Sialic acid TRAP transporter permease protein SiaT [Oceanibacterium hippocampi]
MDLGTITALMGGAIVIFMMLGVPLVFVTGSVAVVTALLTFGPNALPLIASRIYTTVDSYALVAVPMFVLMAAILEKAGVAQELYDAMHVWSGRLKGGVALQTMIAAVVMAAMTGIVGGEIMLLGMVALPQMLRLKYDRKLAIGTICAGGSLGTMIPPSLVLIIYGLTASVSIGDLFLAAIGPGLLLAFLYLGYIWVRCTLNPSLGPPSDIGSTLSFREKIVHLKGLVLPLGVVGVVLGSIYMGIASVSEAAAVGVAGAMVCAAVRRALTSGLLIDSLKQTMRVCGTILWLTFGASALIGVYGLIGGTRFVGDLMTNLPIGPLGIIAVMMLIVFALGMVMDWIGICLLTMPIFVPLVSQLGFDPVWFGVLFCVNVQMAYLSPPFGPAAFFLKSVAPPDITLQEIFAGLAPFIALQAVALGVLLFWPPLALWFVGR